MVRRGGVSLPGAHAVRDDGTGQAGSQSCAARTRRAGHGGGAGTGVHRTAVRGESGRESGRVPRRVPQPQGGTSSPRPRSAPLRLQRLAAAPAHAPCPRWPAAPPRPRSAACRRPGRAQAHCLRAAGEQLQGESALVRSRAAAWAQQTPRPPRALMQQNRTFRVDFVVVCAAGGLVRADIHLLTLQGQARGEGGDWRRRGSQFSKLFRSSPPHALKEAAAQDVGV